ncbi:sulfurtransferase [Gemmatimonas sp.]|uniref:sulfurtransferase n=1 Tax=Gemmatimonas sp. TaxID=1962908 RepID=UPI0027B9D963|nr:rhodanese-like domain-containing protein [Gemmatimonas sp.]
MSSLSPFRGAHVLLAGTALFALSACSSVTSQTSAPASSPAPNTRGANAAPMLVDTKWVAEHIGDRDVVVLHVGTKAQYDSGHVAGSRHVSLDEIALPQVQGGLSLQMAGTEQLTAWAVRNGIGDRTRVVVVPHDFNLQSATRVFFTLAYLGAGDRVSLMDGGYQAWKGEQRAMNTSAPAAAPAVTFTPRVRADLIALASQVEAATQDKSRYIVDARLTRFYNGDGGGYPRPGHIPTAVNIPISSVSVNGFMRPRAELEALFAAQQVDRSKPVITYCHIGQQATLLWFVATLLERDARMYDGSFQEWSGSTRPIIAPAK